MPVDGALLHRTIHRYELLDASRMDAQAEQKDLINDAVEQGLDKVILKRFIRELRRDAALMKAERDTLDEYREAYATFEATPLGAYAKGAEQPMDGASVLKRERAADEEKELLEAANLRDEATDTSTIPDDEDEAAVTKTRRRRRADNVVPLQG